MGALADVVVVGLWSGSQGEAGLVRRRVSVATVVACWSWLTPNRDQNAAQIHSVNRRESGAHLARIFAHLARI